MKTRVRSLRWLRSLAVLAVLSVSVTVHALPNRTLLVSIGNNQGAGDEVTLRYAERDAREVARVFQELGGISGQDTLMLLGEDASTVRGALLKINERIRAEGDKEIAFIVYYSGHADAKALHLGTSELLFSELRSIVRGSAALIRILVVDSCRSGAVSRVKGTQPSTEAAMTLQKELEAEGMAILTSSAAGENSQESDRLRSSFFSHHFVNALRGAADKNRDGNVTLTEAYTYAYHQTVRSSGRTLGLQHPTYRYNIKGRGDLVLTRAADARTHSGRLVFERAGRYLVFEGREGGPLVAELVVGEKGASIALPPRQYFVQRRGRTAYREFRFSLQTAQEVMLNALSYRSVAYDRLVRKGGGERQGIHGFHVMGGARGDILMSQGPTGHVVLGYSLDLSWLSVGVRGRFSMSQTPSVDGAMQMNDTELGFGLVVQRFVDLDWFSVSLGLIVEGIVHYQTFETAGVAPDRQGFGVGFGGLLALERSLWPSVSLRAEGGPISQIIQQSETTEGLEGKSQWVTPLTWWAAAGVVWRF